MKIRLFRTHYPYLKYPPRRTFQIGPLFLGRHFPRCSCWSIDISTATTIACFPSCYALGNGWEEVNAIRTLFARWTQITLHLGPLLITLCLCRKSLQRHEQEYAKAIIP